MDVWMSGDGWMGGNRCLDRLVEMDASMDGWRWMFGDKCLDGWR